MKKSVPLFLLLFFLVKVQSAVAQWTEAYPWTTSYIPPEAFYKDERKQVVVIPKKINVNHSPLCQLETFTELDENMALKIIRNRPFANLSDFADRLSKWASPKRTQRLLARLQSHIMF